MEEHNYICIGEIDFTENVFNEDEIGRTMFKDLGMCKILVYGGERTIEHFHIESPKGYSICICIYTAHYFAHGTHKDILNSSQKKQLNKWMSQENSKYLTTNWKAIESEWWRHNGNPKDRPKNPVQPDYSQLQNYKTK